MISFNNIITAGCKIANSFSALCKQLFKHWIVWSEKLRKKSNIMGENWKGENKAENWIKIHDKGNFLISDFQEIKLQLYHHFKFLFSDSLIYTKNMNNNELNPPPPLTKLFKLTSCLYYPSLSAFQNRSGLSSDERM